MSRKSKVRFLINVGGTRLELFSVRERGSAGILLTIRSTKEGDIGPHHGDLVEERISIHPGTTGPGVTIKLTRALDRGILGDAYAHVLPRGNDFIFPIITVAWPSITAPQRKSVERERDKTIEIGRYSKLNGSLIYTIIATARTTNLRHVLSATGANVSTAQFELFTIYVVHAFLGIPETPWGGMAVLITHPERINGEPTHPYKPNSPIQCDTRESIINSYNMLMDAARDYMYTKIVNWEQRGEKFDKKTAAGFRELMSEYLRRPLQIDWTKQGKT